MVEQKESARWTPSASVDEYIARFPSEVQEKLQELRRVIHESAPDATEVISYQMPTFVLHKNLVHFAAYANHIGFYPTPGGIEAFRDELQEYKTSKGAVQFPLNRPLPLDLIGRIVAYRVEEDIRAAEARAARKKSGGRSR